MDQRILVALMATFISSYEEVSYIHAVKKAIAILNEVKASLD